MKKLKISHKIKNIIANLHEFWYDINVKMQWKCKNAIT